MKELEVLINKAVKESRKYGKSKQVSVTYKGHSDLENRKTDAIVREESFLDGAKWAINLLSKNHRQ